MKLQLDVSESFFLLPINVGQELVMETLELEKQKLSLKVASVHVLHYLRLTWTAVPVTRKIVLSQTRNG